MLAVRARTRVTVPTLVLLLILVLFPLVDDGVRMQSNLTLAMIYAIGAIGLDVLAGYTGQFSFGQFVYFAIGAYVMSALETHAHLNWVLAVVAAVLAAGLVAYVLGSALVRLQHFGSALATFFLAAVALDVLSGNRLARFTGGDSGMAVPSVSVGGTSLMGGDGLYYASLVVLAAGALVCIRYIHVRAGVASRVVKQNQLVAAVLGIRVNREKVRAHVLAGMLAALGGCLFAFSLGFLSPESFDTSQSIDLFAIAAVGGLGSIAGPIVGAAFFFIVTDALSAAAPSSSALLFSIVLLVVVVFFSTGLFGLGEFLWSRARPLLPEALRRRPASPPPAQPRAAADPVAAFVADTDLGTRAGSAGAVLAGGEREALLTVRDLTLAFGGVKALDDVQVSVLRGDVHAIIGPNGAGKTSLLNCISGIQPATDGSVSLGARDMAGISVSSRRNLGIGRTFQHPSLVADLDVRTNVEIGAYDRHDGSILPELLGLPSRRERTRVARRRADEALDLIEFSPTRRAVLAADLTMGEQKQVDIARAIASRPSLLLLDEPTAGLGPEEIGVVARAVKGVREAGITVLVIAHHVGFVRDVADACTVLDFGKVLTVGSPADVLGDERVVEVFVGAGARA